MAKGENMLQIYNAIKHIKRGLIAGLLASAILLAGPALADSGFYLGGSLGKTTLEADFVDPFDDSSFRFDDDDSSWKAYGGFTFDLPVIKLGVEGGYRDLGGPSATYQAGVYGVDVTAWDAFGVAGFDIGPVALFGKLGFISWDADLTIAGFDAGSDDGTDTAYGLGAAINIGSFQIRAEYEVFDVSDVEDLYMMSAGFVYTF
jgi:outer membrane immunogenic protein